LSLLAVCIVVCAGCENTTPTAEEHQAIRTAVSDYLDALAESYSTFDLQPLNGVASPNEIAAVRKLIKNLATTGDRVHSTLRVFEIEHMEVFREINATVRLVEVWEVVRYEATTGVEKGRMPNSVQHTLLQLRLVDGKWLVVGRSVLQRETPVPDEVGESSE
jgi:hypothetical protein